MARRYARDSHGRFSSSGTTAKGGRLGGTRKPGDRKAPKLGAGSRSTSAPQGTIAKSKKAPAAKARPAKMSKAPANPTKQKYQSLKSKSRQLNRGNMAAVEFAGERRGVSRAINNMVANRGVSKKKKR